MNTRIFTTCLVIVTAAAMLSLSSCVRLFTSERTPANHGVHTTTGPGTTTTTVTHY